MNREVRDAIRKLQAEGGGGQLVFTCIDSETGEAGVAIYFVTGLQVTMLELHADNAEKLGEGLVQSALKARTEARAAAIVRGPAAGRH